MQFVWTYWEGGAAGDELRWSIRSIERFCEEETKITIAGDSPSWFRGHVIPLPKIEEEPNHNFQDVLWKLQNITQRSDIDSQFVWMMDDIVALQPFNPIDIAIPRGVRFESFDRISRQKKYLRLKADTLRFLQNEGFSGHWDFGTHAPHLIDKSFLRNLFLTLPIREKCLLWEIVYEVVKNEIRPNHQTVESPFPFLTTQSAAYSIDQLESAKTVSKFLNWGNKEGWNSTLRNWLASQFPDRSKEEE